MTQSAISRSVHADYMSLHAAVICTTLASTQMHRQTDTKTAYDQLDS